jgi:hypothetical protein
MLPQCETRPEGPFGGQATFLHQSQKAFKVSIYSSDDQSFWGGYHLSLWVDRTSPSREAGAGME